MSPKCGNNAAVQAERVQDARFKTLFESQEGVQDAKTESGECYELRVSLYELLRASQPAAAWAMGYMAGWPEMRNG